jgi:hypothetical protein
VQVNGVGALGSTVTAVLEYTPGSGRTTNVNAPTQVFRQTFTVTNGSVSVPINDQDYLGAYRLVLTPAGSAGGDTGALRATASNRCLDVPNQSTTNGTQVQIYDCWTGANQQWTYSAAGELSVYTGTTRKCLDASNGGTANGTAAIIWSCHGGTNQKWDRRSDGSIANRATGLCLDVSGSATTNGALVHLWTCHGGNNQKWTLG